MATVLPFTNAKKELYFPRMATFYDNVAQPLAWTAPRFATGAALVIQGIQLMKDPLGMTAFFDGIGFHPGAVWSIVLLVILVLGGALLALGLYTRPAALAVGVMLLVTLWYHLTYPFGTQLLTQEGVTAVTSTAGLLTREGYALLADGGRSFVELAQAKSVLLSILWSGIAFLFAAFGGGYFSLDRKFLRKRY